MQNKWLIIGAAGLIFVIVLVIGFALNKNLTANSTETSEFSYSETAPAPGGAYPIDTPYPLVNGENTQTNPGSSETASALEFANSATAVTTTTSTTAQATMTPVAISTQTRTLAPTSTFAPTLAYTVIPSATNTATQVPTRTVTPTPALGSISGRITFQGAPVSGGLQLSLEDYLSNEIRRITVGADGSYTFADLPVSPQGYNVVFAQEWNEQYPMEQVVSWAWIGPIAIFEGSKVQLNNFDISLMGLVQTNPMADTSISAASINQATPLVFGWSTYPAAVQYWVDLMQRDEQNQVWQSNLTSSNSVAFDGILWDGTQISPGTYWWAVGAQGNQGGYPVTVYGYLLRLLVAP